MAKNEIREEIKKFLETIFQGNGQEKKAGIAILISDKIDFKEGP